MSEPTLVLGSRYAEAVAYASQVHAHHTRKGTAIAYMCHVLGVSSLVIEAGGDEDMAIAALLHDAAEDGGGTERLADIATHFGSRVAYLVGACSDSLTAEGAEKSPWRERKKAHLERLLVADDAAAFVVAADKLHNARALCTDIQLDGVDTLTRFNAGAMQIAWYYDEALKVLVRKNVPDVLLQPLMDLMATMRPTLRAIGQESRELRRTPNPRRPLERDLWILGNPVLFPEPLARHLLGRDAPCAFTLLPDPGADATLQYAVATSEQVLRSLPMARIEVLTAGPRWEIRVFRGAQSDLVVAFRSDGRWVEYDGLTCNWAGVKEGGPATIGWVIADKYARAKGEKALARPRRTAPPTSSETEPEEAPPPRVSMSEWTLCDKYGHEWTVIDATLGIEECGYCGSETRQSTPSGPT